MIKAQGRMIRKTINESESFAVLSERSQVLFCLLIPHYSAHGKQNGNPFTIKGTICPKIDYFTIPVIVKCLEEITAKTDVKWYEINGTKYIHAINFDNHQDLREDRMGEDHIPDCPDELRTSPGLLQDHSGYKDKEKTKVNENKNKYLDFVFLTDTEYQSLKDRFPDINERIERLNNYIGSKGTRYKSHYHTILAWAKNDKTSTQQAEHISETTRLAREKAAKEAEDRRAGKI